MKTAPDASCRLCCALHRSALEGLDLCTRRVKEQLDLFANSGRLEFFEANDFVASIDCDE